MKVFISGGGTGGHFYPAQSVALKLKKRGYKVYYFGTVNGIEAIKNFPSEKKYLFNISGVRGKNLINSLFSSFNLIKTAFKISKIIKKEKPEFIICFGGYASLPLGLAGFFTKTPVFLHEQNSIPSYTNLLLSRISRKIFISFEYSRKYFPSEKTILSGLPLRESFKRDIKASKTDALKFLSVKDKKTVLVIGGSQGSRSLSEVAIETSKILSDYQFILIGGKHFNKPVSLPENVVFFDFIERIGLAYVISDIIVSRAGASSTFEIMASGKYSIFVPFPYAASNHQFFNVKWIEELGGCKIINENELSPKILAEAIKDGFDSKSKSLKLKKYFIDNAEDIIVNGILNEINKI